MPGHLILFAIDAVAVFGALLLAAGNAVRLPRNRNAWLVNAILLGHVCAVLAGRHDYGYWIPEAYRIDVGMWHPLLNVGRNLSPALFMLLCHSLFQEPRRFPRWLLAVVGVQVLLEEPIHLVAGSDSTAQRLLTEAAPALLQALFVALAVYWTVAGWAVDLVETRRRMRIIVLTLVGLLMAGSALLLRVIIPWDIVENYYASVVMGGLAVVMLSVVLVSLLSAERMARYLDPCHVPTPRMAPAEPQRNRENAVEVARLRELMEVEHAYRQTGLSVGGLAERMGMPEYRLRKLIHEELGYRNFNAFLHEYRIAEACRRLRDPGQRRTPILTIALDVGYQSINTFNRGFREVTGVTPSTYRAGTDEPGRDEASKSLTDF